LALAALALVVFGAYDSYIADSDLQWKVFAREWIPDIIFDDQRDGVMVILCLRSEVLLVRCGRNGSALLGDGCGEAALSVS